MPSQLVRKRDIQQLLLLVVSVLQSVSATLYQLRTTRNAVNGSQPEDADSDALGAHERMVEQVAASTAVGVFILLAMLTKTQRGPYRRSKEFFEVARSWRDREFRHLFRCVVKTIFSAL